MTRGVGVGFGFLVIVVVVVVRFRVGVEPWVGSLAGWDVDVVGDTCRTGAGVCRTGMRFDGVGVRVRLGGVGVGVEP